MSALASAVSFGGIGERIVGAVSAAPATLAIAGGTLGLHALTLLLPGAFDVLVHSDAGLANGETWRLVTAHLVHLDTAHLAPNLVGLLALGIALERGAGPGTPLVPLALAGLAITLGVVLDPSVGLYCGLSGVLNALFAALCLIGLKSGPRALWGGLLAAGLAKIGWEWGHAPLLTDTLSTGALAWPPHVASHLVGYLAGMAWGTVTLLRDAARRMAHA